MIRPKLYRRAPLPPKGGIIYINEGKMPLAISRARQSAFYRSYLRKGRIGLSSFDAPEAGHGKGWTPKGPTKAIVRVSPAAPELDPLFMETRIT